MYLLYLPHHPHDRADGNASPGLMLVGRNSLNGTHTLRARSFHPGCHCGRMLERADAGGGGGAPLVRAPSPPRPPGRRAARQSRRGRALRLVPPVVPALPALPLPADGPGGRRPGRGAVSVPSVVPALGAVGGGQGPKSVKRGPNLKKLLGVPR